MEQHEDEILQGIEELRIWQEQQTNGNGQISDSQLALMRQLGLSFDSVNLTSVTGDEEDDNFFEDIERQIQAIRSGNSSMRGGQSLDDTPVLCRKSMDFEATPLKSVDLNKIRMEDELEVSQFQYN